MQARQVTFPGNVGVTQTLVDFDVTGASVLFNAGAPQTVSVKAQGGNTATITGAVTLAQNLTVDTSGATPNNLTFSTGASTINAAAAGVQGLTLDAGAGRIDLQGVVGTSALADLTVSSAATARFGNNVTTTGPQNVNAGTIQTNGTHTTAGNNIVLNGNLTLQSNTVLNTGGGAISVTGTTDGGFALIANSSGATTFTGAVGGSAPLALSPPMWGALQTSMAVWLKLPAARPTVTPLRSVRPRHLTRPVRRRPSHSTKQDSRSMRKQTRL